LLGIEKPKRGYTLEEYADRKGFAVVDLQRWGLHTRVGKYGDDELVIPYRAADGSLLREKIRTAGKSFWGEGSGTYPYGLDVLARADSKEPIIFCEGESDCHACWQKGVLAIGIPGAAAWKSEWTKHFLHRPIFIWKEPDPASDRFVQSLAASFAGAKVIDATKAGVKDLAELFRVEGGKNFRTKVKTLMADARAICEPARQDSRFIELCGEKLDELLVLKQQPIDAVPTPLTKWNSRCRDFGGGVGLARGWHITIGANTGNGKSILSLNLAHHAIRHGEQVCFVSLEMSWQQVATRFMSIASGEKVEHLEPGTGLNPATHRQAARSVERLKEQSGGALWCNERNISSLGDITDAIRYQHEFRGCRYAVVDYMQLANVAGSKDILEAVTRISAEVRRAARDLNIVTVGLSQFNRETSKDYENPPTPQGLMGGSPLENDSDQVLLIDHSSYARHPATNTARQTLILAKNRHGASGPIECDWDYNTLRISQIEQSDPAPFLPQDRGEAWEPEEDTPDLLLSLGGGQ
jgi:KaiC/GvpD/RAD55 family RecA-like ATPase